jgi:hypothetical protein
LIVDEAAQASSISGSALSDREGFASGSLSGSGRSGRGSTGRCRSGGGNTSSSVGLPAASVHSERAAVFFVSESRAQVGTLLSTGSILSSPDALVLEGGANSLSSSLTAERKRSAFSDESVDTRRRLNVLAVSRGAVAWWALSLAFGTHDHFAVVGVASSGILQFARSTSSSTNEATSLLSASVGIEITASLLRSSCGRIRSGLGGGRSSVGNAVSSGGVPHALQHITAICRVLPAVANVDTSSRKVIPSTVSIGRARRNSSVQTLAE